MDWFKRAIGSNPDYVVTYINLGFLQQNQGKMTRRWPIIKKTANLEPNGPADYFNRANIAANSYQWDEAITC